MHIQANAKYNLYPLTEKVVLSWTHFVPLFLTISGFGMFCGYYERFQNNNISLNEFYTKRLKKTLPFFTFLIALDIILSRSVSHIIEGVMEITMSFGLLPNNNLSVIGVSWTLGVIFLFYMLFPYIVFLFWNLKRSVFVFLISIVISLFCSSYFFSDSFVIPSFVPRHCFLYCTPFFFGGGIVYLFRNKIENIVNKNRWLFLLGIIAIVFLWYNTPWTIKNTDISMIKNLILFMPILMYSISVKSIILSNGVVKRISSISLELYLAQMVVYRMAEKLKVLYLFGRGFFSFVFVCVLVVAGLLCFIGVYNFSLVLINRKFAKK